MKPALVAVAALAACTTPTRPPCEGDPSTCLALHVSSPMHVTLDQLDLDILYAGRHSATTTTGHVTLPVDTFVDFSDAGPFTVGVVAAATLGGTVLAVGAGQTQVDTHATLDLVLGPPPECTAGRLYCGGDKLPGDPQTLYACTAGGAPIAHGTCPAECLVRASPADTCAAVGGTCVDNTNYCGGDKLQGDPAALYRCSRGSGVFIKQCDAGCLVRPGLQDVCE